MIEVIDNLIPEAYQEEIERIWFGKDINWGYKEETTVPSWMIDNRLNTRPCFVHLLCEHGNPCSNYYNFISPMIYMALDRVGMGHYRNINFMRSFLQLPLDKTLIGNQVDPAHIDTEQLHIVVLYYVCDSDGDTIIYDKVYEGGDAVLFDTNSLPIKTRVTPKRGRAIVFDGRYFHTAEQPSKNKRCIINTNIN